MSRLIKNAAKCNKCGDVVISQGRHDFRWCKCENIAVDGGLAYTRRLFKSDEWEELSEYSEDSFEPNRD